MSPSSFIERKSAIFHSARSPAISCSLSMVKIIACIFCMECQHRSYLASTSPSAAASVKKYPKYMTVAQYSSARFYTLCTARYGECADLCDM